MSNWIQWKADGKTDIGPVPDHIWVEIMMLDGEIWQEFSFDLNWGLIDEPGEIIAYRIPTDRGLSIAAGKFIREVVG